MKELINKLERISQKKNKVNNKNKKFKIKKKH